MADTNLLVLAREYAKLREDVKKVLSLPKGDKGDQGEKGDKGDQGDRGLQGVPGKDGKDGINGIDGKNGRDGKDGKDGKDGLDGVGVSNAYIDFDNSLVIVLTSGQEINAGYLSQETKDSIVATFKQGAYSINELLPSQTGNNNKYLKTDGTNVSWDTLDGSDINLSSPPTIGNVTPAAGTFTTLTANSTFQAGRSSANYFQAVGAAANNVPIFSTQGSDTNISMAFQPKGTGAINLSAGSRGVNVSNGGTVTAITRTTTGSGYSSLPTVTVSAPTTAGGVQATAAVAVVGTTTASIQSGGTGYTVNDVISTNAGASQSSAATFTVTGVSGGVITSIASTGNGGSFTAIPTNPVAVTGGTGTGATLNLSGFYIITVNVTNAGSGYVEQPTVSFSGGGGSGAAAYATVGSGTTIKSIGSASERSLAFQGPSGYDILQLDGSAALTSLEAVRVQPTSFGRTNVIAVGSANSQMWLAANGSGYLAFCTNGTSLTNQMRVTHTANAVNRVEVTGAATGGRPTISAQGSDSSVALTYSAKGSENHVFTSNSGAVQFVVVNRASAANWITARGNTAGNAPNIGVEGSDTNIDLNLTTKGTGSVSLSTGTSGVGARVVDQGIAGDSWVELRSGSSSSGGTYVSSSSRSLYVSAVGGNQVRFFTNGAGVTEQMRVAHTASAVNYVQVTGAATGSAPVISAQGSDTNIQLQLASKGTGLIRFVTGSGLQAYVSDTASVANQLVFTGGATGTGPTLSAAGSDTNINLRLTPKGTGRVQFGTHTATADTAISGYIEILDSGGTIRKLAVIT